MIKYDSLEEEIYLNKLRKIHKLFLENKELFLKYGEFNAQLKFQFVKLFNWMYSSLAEDFAGQELLYYLFIRETEEYYYLNYCVDAGFDDETDEPYATFMEVCVEKKLAKIYFINFNKILYGSILDNNVQVNEIPNNLGANFNDEVLSDNEYIKILLKNINQGGN